MLVKIRDNFHFLGMERGRRRMEARLQMREQAAVKRKRRRRRSQLLI